MGFNLSWIQAWGDELRILEKLIISETPKLEAFAKKYTEDVKLDPKVIVEVMEKQVQDQLAIRFGVYNPDILTDDEVWKSIKRLDFYTYRPEHYEKIWNFFFTEFWNYYKKTFVNFVLFSHKAVSQFGPIKRIHQTDIPNASFRPYAGFIINYERPKGRNGTIRWDYNFNILGGFEQIDELVPGNTEFFNIKLELIICENKKAKNWFYTEEDGNKIYNKTGLFEDIFALDYLKRTKEFLL